MNEVPTLIVSELDDARTLVDPRFARRIDPRCSNEPPVDQESPPKPRLRFVGSATGSGLRSPKRQMVQTVVFVSVVLGLAFVAYQQWRVAEALRESINTMALSPAASARARTEAQQAASPLPAVPLEPTPEPIIKPLASEREPIERQAVSALASNDFAEALAQYRSLSHLFPEFAPYRDAATVLAAKLGCGHGLKSTDGACR